MSFDYVQDEFGKVVKTLPEYAPIEAEAIDLLGRISEQSISHDEIFDGFIAVHKQMLALEDNTIREGEPQWLTKFIAFNFLRWRDWYLLRKSFIEHPEQFNTMKLLSQYLDIARMGLDDEFFEACRYCLGELQHKINKTEE